LGGIKDAQSHTTRKITLLDPSNRRLGVKKKWKETDKFLRRERRSGRLWGAGKAYIAYNEIKRPSPQGVSRKK